jgi:hypothetical protein
MNMAFSPYFRFWALTVCIWERSIWSSSSIHANESVALRTEILPAFSANFSAGTGCGIVFAERTLWQLTRLAGIRDYFHKK